MMFALGNSGSHKFYLLFFFIFPITISCFSQSYTEGFDVVVPLPSGWASQNLSTPIGTAPNYFQGNVGVFSAQSGDATSYAGVNFNSVAGTNTISHWLFTPNRVYNNGDVFSFYTRTVNSPSFADRLQIRLSVNGASVNVGSTNSSLGDFTTLLLDINPTLTTSGYPNTWTQYTITLSGLPSPTSGRIAFRYFVPNGGPTGANSDYIGIDNVSYTSGPSCTMTASATVSSNYNGAQISCFGANDGVIAASPTGGTAPYTYSWSDGSTDANNTMLTAGSYQVTVTDASSCSATATSTITQPAVVSPSTNVTNVSCNGGNNGVIDLSVTGGTGSYTYQWSNGAVSQDITGLVAGNYNVTVLDANGCSASTSAMVTQPLSTEFTFIGPGSDFNVAANWLGGCVPPLHTPGTLITINSGQTLNLTGNLTADIINNGTLTGNVNLTGNLTNNGTVSPGN